jgi:phosphoribosylformylglycinamidine synthase
LTNLFAADVSDLSRVVLSANWMAAAGAEGEDQALYDAVYAVGMELCPRLGIAIPVGKDSLSMRTSWTDASGAARDVVAPLTLIVSAFAPVADARLTMTPVLVRTPSKLLLVDPSRGRNRLGGSALAQVYGQLGDVCPDLDDPDAFAAMLTTVARLRREGLLLAGHDRSDGGLIVALAEMAFAGRIGWRVDIGAADLQAALFAEELGMVLQVAPDHVDRVVAAFEGCEVTVLGDVGDDESLVVEHRGRRVLEATRAQLERVWAETSYRMQALRDHPECAVEEFEAIGLDDPGLGARPSFDPDDTLGIAIVGARPRVAVLREQGVNGQLEMAAAFDRAGFEPVDVHMSDLLAGEVDLHEFPVLAACGGFSYGDVLGGGGGWAKSVLFHNRLNDAMRRFFEADRLVLGICNGCQMLAQLTELIPGAQHWPRFVRNRSEQFEGRTVLVRINPSSSPWLTGMVGSLLPVPLAHGEGRAEFAVESALDALTSAGDLAIQYVDNRGNPTVRYPANPNGAPQGLAGITAAQGRVLAMMPHPERAFRACANAWRDPRWNEDGPWLRLFRNARAALA